jgi:leucyl/phenylalanyl-tRNA--protein transferase
MQDRPSLMIPQLGSDPAEAFPDPETALEYPDGLLAWGGDLHPQRLLSAYANGIFPWYSGDQPILWWCPSTRCVLYPDDIHVSRRLHRQLKQGRYRVTADRAFEQVIHGCALPRAGQESTWITPEMTAAYCLLHHLGHAHSIEVWREDDLVGGLYGLSIGRVFFGESMFSLAPNASKVAMARLCEKLLEHDFAMLDCQVHNPHLERMGAVEISRSEYLGILEKHVHREPPGLPWAEILAA